MCIVIEMCMHVNKCSFRKAGQVVLEIKIISMAKTLLRGFGEKINISIAFSMNCYPLELLTPSSGDRTCTQSSALWEIVVSGSCDLCWTWRPSQGLLGFISFQLFHYVGLFECRYTTENMYLCGFTNAIANILRIKPLPSIWHCQTPNVHSTRSTRTLDNCQIGRFGR